MKSFHDGRVNLWDGDCREVLAGFEANSFDACVCDPPYELNFMGRKWDNTQIAHKPETWAAVLRVLKPGAHLVAFHAPKNWHRLALAIEEAGFEIRDTLTYFFTFGSGFPKSHNLDGDWKGWGSALKPAFENIVCAQKPSLYQPEWVTISNLIFQLGARLWSMLSATDAASHFRLSEAEFERLASVQWSADSASNTRDALCDQMGTLRFEWAMISSLNTVFSWRNTLDAIWNSGNTSIIATELRTTTDWRILKSFLSQITPASIIQAQLPEAKSNAPAFLAARLFSGTLAQLSATLEQPVLANAIAPFARHFRDADDLSPAYEPIVLARKPLIGTIAANVMEHGTGAINIDACRVEPTGERLGGGGEKRETAGKFTNEGWRRPWMDDPSHSAAFADKVKANVEKASRLGRWPATLLHDGSKEVVEGFPETGEGAFPSSRGLGGIGNNGHGGQFGLDERKTDSGSAARFFYTAKADAADRVGSKHPTVKPIDLMQWLVRLVTPPKGRILDCFAGTGTTAEAALREGFRCTLIEREPEYLADIERRMALVFEGETSRSVAMAKLQDEGDALPLFRETERKIRIEADRIYPDGKTEHGYLEIDLGDAPPLDDVGAAE